MNPELHERVYNWHTRRLDGAGLLAEIRKHVAAVSKNYPDAYFELGRRDESALASLANRVFTSCHCHPRGPHPFLQRPPFQAYTEEKMGGRPIRYQTFYAWRSVTRELLRDDYKKTVARDPALQWKDALYRSLGPILENIAEAVPSGDGRSPVYQSTSRAPRLSRSDAEIIRILKTQPDQTLPGLVSLCLNLLNRPISQSALCHLLAEVLGGPETSTPQSLDDIEAVGSEDAGPSAERLAVRASVIAAWEALEPLDRVLLLGLARGEETANLLAQDPRLKNPVALSRAATRINNLFLRRILNELGAEANAAALPRELIDAIFGVLSETLPELA